MIQQEENKYELIEGERRIKIDSHIIDIVDPEVIVQVYEENEKSIKEFQNFIDNIDASIAKKKETAQKEMETATTRNAGIKDVYEKALIWKRLKEEEKKRTAKQPEKKED